MAYEWTETDAKIFHDVQEYGWHVMIVADEPWYAYTIGLYARFQQPELLVSGLSKEDLHAVCNQYGAAVRDGQTRPDLGEYRSVRPETVEERCGIGRWFYRNRTFPVVELVIAA